MDKTIKEKDVSEEVLVYKYRDWEKEFHKILLLENQIYLAPPKEFNDPFDCQINDNFSCLSEEEKDCYINDQFEFLKEVTKVDISNEEFERGVIRKKLEDTKKLHEEFNEIYNNRIGVFSCCRDEETKKGWRNFLKWLHIKDIETKKGWQNILMWSHYANYHKGFCVGFYKDKLNCELQVNLPNQMLKGGFVDYNKKFPILKPLVPISKNKKEIGKNYMTGIKTKAKNWEYENEYRLVRINLDSNEPELKNRKVNLRDDCIAEVTLGLWIKDCHKEAITNICKSKGIKLYQAVKKPFEFSITRKEIDLN